MELLLPIIVFFLLGVIALYVWQVAKNVAYVLFVIMLGIAAWYFVSPMIKQYQFSERIQSVLPPEEAQKAQEILGGFDGLPSRSAIEDAVQPGVDAVKKAETVDNGELPAEEEQSLHASASEPSLLSTIAKAVLHVLADAL